MSRPPNGPLAGVKVVLLASLGPGPYGVMLLADMGADVVVVDRLPALAGSMPPELDPRRRGQRSIAVDLKTPAGLRVVQQLVSGADVLVEGMRPGTAERLGLGPEQCRANHPGLIYARMTGWGQDGPDAMKAGHDINYVAATGALHAMGAPGTPPPVPLNLLGDYAGGGAFLALGVLAAILERQSTGVGAVIDSSIVDGVTSLTTATVGMAAAGLWGDRGQNAFDGSRPWYRTYATRDGEYMAVGAVEDKFYEALLQVLGLDPVDWIRSDGMDQAALAQTLEAVFATQDRDSWTKAFSDVDACVSPVLSFQEAQASAAATDRAAYVEIAGVVQPAPLPRWVGADAAVPAAPPGNGRDTVDVLQEAGFRSAEIGRLQAEGVVGGGADA